MNPDKLQAEAMKDQFISLLIDSGAIPHILRIADHGPADTDDDRELCKVLACMAMGEICMMQRIDIFLHEEWCELRNGASAAEIIHFGGMVRALHQVGVLTDDQRELWERRSNTCPGHDDEGCRAWCAYCGNMPPCGQDDCSVHGATADLR